MTDRQLDQAIERGAKGRNGIRARRRAWEDEPEARERDDEPRFGVMGRAVLTADASWAAMSAEERKTVPWQQPAGVCVSCDKRRAFNARRMASAREKGKDW